MLTSMALVASLALSAQAGRLTLSSAKQTHGPNKGQPSASARQAGNSSWHHILFPASTYMVDDGTTENAVGLTLGGDIIALNKFAVLPGAETIATVSIAWGTSENPDPSLNGLPYTAAIWSDPNGDGNPSDAVLLNTAGGVVANAGTDTFITTDIPDTTITTTNFFVGFLIPNTFAGQFPEAFDETPPTFSNVSYVAGGSSDTGDINNLNNNDLRLRRPRASASSATGSFGPIRMGIRRQPRRRRQRRPRRHRVTRCGATVTSTTSTASPTSAAPASERVSTPASMMT